MPSQTDATTRTVDPTVDSTNDKTFIVEKVLQRRFHPHRQQYEFFVKWRGTLCQKIQQYPR